MKILITAFDPFGGEEVNPALEAVRALPGEIAGARLVKGELPTVFGRSREVLAALVERERPDLVIAVGQAGGRAQVSLERVAINIDDARIPDNEGNQPVDEPVEPGGPPALFATLPIKAMVEAIRAAGIPAGVTNSAGTFVCNHLMYGLLFLLQEEYPGVRGGFIHVPYIPAQVLDCFATPSMSLADIVKALELAVAAAVK